MRLNSFSMTMIGIVEYIATHNACQKLSRPSKNQCRSSKRAARKTMNRKIPPISVSGPVILVDWRSGRLACVFLNLLSPVCRNPTPSIVFSIGASAITSGVRRGQKQHDRSPRRLRSSQMPPASADASEDSRRHARAQKRPQVTRSNGASGGGASGPGSGTLMKLNPKATAPINKPKTPVCVTPGTTSSPRVQSVKHL